ncbi:MAG TPA: M1 family aminopeptidase [Gemmatimonadales bacterium]|nr:M1 family aminopeptidase [Gemmatimonadales bacterium]
MSRLNLAIRAAALAAAGLAALPAADRLRAQSAADENRTELRIARYTLDVRIAEAFTGGLNLTARATLALVARAEVAPSLRFTLDSKLTADSARWGTGESLRISKAEDGDLLSVEAPHGLQAGDTAALTIYYHGGRIDRFANMFFIDPATAWYPINRQGPRTAAFDLTFHAPARYPLISIGARTDSSREGNVVTTRWVAERPTPYATFNLGLFESYHAEQPGAAPLDVLFSEEAHREIRRIAAENGYFLIEQSQKPQRVADDVANALKLFTSLFGASPYTHFYVTEIPYAEGVSFPGLIDFSFGTFQNTELDGFDEFFRAHETAHQWWGNGVLPGASRDRWLSEGFASFSGLWYLQAVRKRSDDYFRFLDRYRSDIEDVRADARAIWSSDPASSKAASHDREIMVYEKGAWVLNMLRVLMLDLRALSDDRFIATLRDYYQAYDGSPASTEDFQHVVEQHIGMPMDWFFDEWVKRTEIPTYHVAWTAEPQADGRFRVRLRVRQEGVGAAFHMPVLVAADLGGDRTARFRVDVGGGLTEYVSPLLPSEPQRVTFNDLHAVLAEVRTERW